MAQKLCRMTVEKITTAEFFEFRVIFFVLSAKKSCLRSCEAKRRQAVWRRAKIMLLKQKTVTELRRSR